MKEGHVTVPIKQLTPRESEIAIMVCAGKRNSDIAKAVGLTVNIVKNDLKQVFRVLNVKSRTELMLAMERIKAAKP